MRSASRGARRSVDRGACATTPSLKWSNTSVDEGISRCSFKHFPVEDFHLCSLPISRPTNVRFFESKPIRGAFFGLHRRFGLVACTSQGEEQVTHPRADCTASRAILATVPFRTGRYMGNGRGAATRCNRKLITFAPQ